MSADRSTQAKELIAGLVGAEVDKLAETKGAPSLSAPARWT